jgi:hypothetical protein
MRLAWTRRTRLLGLAVLVGTIGADDWLTERAAGPLRTRQAGEG